MPSSIRLYSNNVLLGEIELNNTADKSEGIPGAYMDIFYATPEGIGLAPGVVYDPAYHLHCISVENTKFPKDDFELVSRMATNKLKLGERVHVTFVDSGLEVKRRDIVAANYWFFIENDKYKEKIRLTIDELL